MTYLVLARKYRPLTFEEVVGQAPIVQTLRRAIQQNKTSHAYLFAGPRGIGKTSLARIFSKALNCSQGPTVSPDNTCEICREISAGSSLDVLEIDGASNRGIEEIRALRDNVNLRPAKARYKVYIIDEVHMLTEAAFNALLKTLEEPPDYVKFIFATTAPEKVPSTILSRCQRFDFHPVPLAEMKQLLSEIARKEKMEVESAALERIVEFSCGSLRDSLSILDQLIVYTPDNRITREQVQTLLGLVEGKSVEEIVHQLVRGQSVEAITLLHRLLQEGKDGVVLLDELVRKFRNAGFFKLGEPDFFPESRQFLAAFEKVSLEKILEAISLSLEYRERIRRETIPVVLMEILFLKLARLLESPAPTAPERPPEKDTLFFEKAESRAAVPVKPEPRPEEKAEAKETEAPAPQPAGPVDVEANWARFLAEVKRAKATVAACLKEGKLEKAEGKAIQVSFPEKFSFHRSMVEKPPNRKIIEKAGLDVFGPGYTFSFSVRESSQKSLLEQTGVKEVIEFFNGEVVELEE